MYMYKQCCEEFCRGGAGGGQELLAYVPKTSGFKQLYEYYGGGITLVLVSESHTWGGGGGVGGRGCLSLDSLKFDATIIMHNLILEN